jgi:hypothetical protein
LQNKCRMQIAEQCRTQIAERAQVEERTEPANGQRLTANG